MRELENRVKRAVIMADGKLISGEDLDLNEAEGSEPEVLNIKSAREQSDRKVIRHALAHRRQYLQHGQAARDQPANPLRSAQAV